MSQQNLGILIGSTFGLIYVLVNAGPLPAPVAVSLRVLAVLAYLAIVVAARRAPDRGDQPGPDSTRPGAAPDTAPEQDPRRSSFGRYYRIVVAVEVVVGLAGLAVINGPLHASQVAVAWVSVVVGVHFVALALVWRQPVFRLLGAIIAGCGVLGFGLGLLLGSGSTAQAWISLVAGVLPGAVLLAGGWTGLARGRS